MNPETTETRAAAEAVVETAIPEPVAPPQEQGIKPYCALPPVKPREFGPEVSARRAELILVSGNKWVNGTVLHYYFFDKDTDGEYMRGADGVARFVTWKAPNEQEKKVVRDAFATWKALGLGLEFREVAHREDAEIRIGFNQHDGSWSYIGRDVLDQGKNARTMNFGWQLSGWSYGFDTALHEIGHTLGFPHEHQNPLAGIEWDEEAVYRYFGGAPNNWSRSTTFNNIIRKITPDSVQGSNWDPNSVMHYQFEKGLIKKPDTYREHALIPAGNLSQRDRQWALTFYPTLEGHHARVLRPLESQTLSLAPAEQANFSIDPPETRTYEMRTFGASDVVMVLFEQDGDRQRYVAGDDDSGEGRNAYLKVRLVKGRRYTLRIRMYYSNESGNTGVMLW